MKQNTPNNQSNTPHRLLEMGKIPPQAIDLEEAVLGALMLDKDAMYAVVEILKPEIFYKEAHAKIFTAIESIFHRNVIPDILTVTQELISTGDLGIAGGAYYVTQLTNRVASSANVEVHTKILQEKFVQREFIRMAQTTLQAAYSDECDIFELIENTENIFSSINEQTVSEKSQTVSQVMESSLQQILEAKQNKGLIGVASGFYNLDAITNGWQKKKLYVLAARPGSGKSTMMLNCAVNAFTYSKAKALVFSLEMNNTELGVKMISTKSSVSHHALNRGSVNEEDMARVHQGIQELRGHKIFFEDKASLTINQIKMISRKYKRKEGIGIVFIDYLQKVKASKSNPKFREQEISEVSSELKNLSKEIDLPVVALAQLSREVEKRPNKKPMLSDLRESGAIEQDADVVMFIYRPGVYGIEEDGEGRDIRDTAKIIVAKHRGGKLGEVEVRFQGDISKFSDPEQEPTSPV